MEQDIKQTDDHSQGTRVVSGPVITISDLHKAFGSNSVLRGVNLTLNTGENLSVIGHSGSGKSVLIKCIAGLVRPDKGNIYIFAKDITECGRHELNHLRSKIGFLFQGNALFDSMSVQSNLEFFLVRRARDKSRKEITMLVDESLENVGLSGTNKMMPSELSGGMKKRISLARALILRPELMLYDEPTTGLDPVTSREISHLMVEMQQKYKMSSIIISHDIQCIRITSNRIIALIDGVNYAEGTFEELKHSQDKKVNSFFE